MIEQHLESWSRLPPKSVAEILRSLDVDELISGGPTVSKAKKLKCDAVTIFSDAGFELHKWHSYAPELEESLRQCTNDSEDTYVKQQLGTNASEEGSKLLGLEWNKVADTLAVAFSEKWGTYQKRNFGETSPYLRSSLSGFSRNITGKIYLSGCMWGETSLGRPLPDALAAKWKRWESDLPESMVVTRTLAPYQEPINAVELHAFGDASGCGVVAAVYAVLKQDTGTTQGWQQ